MSCIRHLGIGLLASGFIGGCENTPTVTRTGDVKDIVIGDKLSAAEVSVSRNQWSRRTTSLLKKLSSHRASHASVDSSVRCVGSAPGVARALRIARN